MARRVHGQNGETLLRVNLSADGMLHFDRAEIVAAIRDERDGIGAMLAKFFHSFSKRGIPAGGTDWLGRNALVSAVSAMAQKVLLAVGRRRGARSAALGDHDEHAAFGANHMFGALDDRPAIGSRLLARLFFRNPVHGSQEFIARS